jgi:hypothetical protein
LSGERERERERERQRRRKRRGIMRDNAFYRIEQKKVLALNVPRPVCLKNKIGWTEGKTSANFL